MSHSVLNSRILGISRAACRLTVYLWASAALAACGEINDVGVEQAASLEQAISLETQDMLAEAKALYDIRLAERLLVATDSNEKFDTIMIPFGVNYLVENEDYDILF